MTKKSSLKFLLLCAAVLLLVALAVGSGKTRGEDELECRYKGGYGGTYRDVAYEGNYLYATHGYYLSVFDVSTPHEPERVGYIQTAGEVWGVAVDGDHAYVASGENGLVVVNVSDPEGLRYSGGYNTEGFANGVAVSGDHVYVADGENGLVVVNVSDPGNPQYTGRYDTDGEAFGVSVSDGHAYVADRYSGLVVVDVSDPTDPQYTGGYDTEHRADDVVVRGDYAYVADGYDGGLVVVDVSDPTDPQYVNDSSSHHARAVTVSDDYAYIADNTVGLVVVNISDPAEPQRTGSYDTGSARGVAVVGDHAYVADHNNGLLVVNVSDPADPKEEGTLGTTDDARDAVVSGNDTFVADYSNGLIVVDTTDPGSPVLKAHYDGAGSANGIAVSGNYTYIACDKKGLFVVDVSDPGNPQYTGKYDTAGEALDVAINGSYAYVTDEENGLVVVDVSDPENPKYAGRYDTTDHAQGVAVVGDYAYVAVRNDGLVIVDVSDPSDPQYVGDHDTIGNAQDVTVSNEYAYVANGVGGLVIIDVTNKTDPEKVGSCNTPGDACRVVVSGDYAYVAAEGYGLFIANVSNRADPQSAGSYDTAGDTVGVAVTGDHVYVADKDNGLVIVEMERLPQRPRAIINSILPNPALKDEELRFDGEGSGGTIVALNWRVVNGSGVEVHNDSSPPESLPVGNYTIFFSVKNDLGLWSGEVNTTLVVHRRPTASIHSISPNPTYHYENVRFQGNGTDDGEITCYSWRSSIDRELYNGTNASFTISNLSRGTHTIYLKVQDDHGIWSEEVAGKLEIKPEPRKQASNIGLYMRDVDDCLTLWVEASKDDDITFDLRLENYNASDPVERVVLLYVITNVRRGDRDNWEFAFSDAENGGIPIYEGEHPDYGVVSFYKYVVKGDGTSTNVTFWFWHDYEIPIDNQDDIEFLIHGLDYEAEDEPEPGDELDRFLFKIIENGSAQNHNVTYLMEDGETPNVDVTNAKGWRIFVLANDYCFCVPLHLKKSSITMAADEIYDELVVTVENELGQEDELNLVAVLDDSTAEWWNITAQAPYTLGDFVPVDGSPCGVNRYFDVTLLISLKDPANYTKVPHGNYDLKLTAESRLSGRTYVTTVTINLLQRYDPLFNLDPTDTDDKCANTDGNATTFKFRLKNNGTLTDTISLVAEAGDMASRAGDTNEYWTKEFYPTSPVTLAPGETVDVYLNITPTLDNTKIYPGKYPVYVNVTSDNNLARRDVAAVYVRMPSLYEPPDDPVAPPFRIGSEEVLSFTVKNLGKAEDTLALGLEIRDSSGALVSSRDEPGSWLFSFENADTGFPLTDLSVTLPSWAEQDVHLRITPLPGTASGDYTLHISITPGEAGQDPRTVDVPLTILPLDLWIRSEDIEIIPPEVDEGEEVVIRATVHLDGAIETPVNVEFFYKTASSGFVYLGGIELDFGGKANTAKTVTFTWNRANMPNATGQNIRVWVDAADLVEEENETNNAASATITVRESEAGEPHSSFLWVGLVATAILILVIPAVMFLPKFISRKQKGRKKGKTENQ